MTAVRRRRRTPEQAREDILVVAAERLREHGLKGLNVKDVAAAAGMSHATLLHHFGSADQMQKALVVRLTRNLISDLLEVLGGSDENASPEQICEKLFATMARDGHVRLAAWVMVSEQQMVSEEDNAPLFAELVVALGKRLGLTDPDEARRTIVLCASTAIGFELVRDALPPLVGLEPSETASFPRWLAGRLPGLSGV